MVVVIRIDLDKYDLAHLTTFYVNGVITMGELAEAKAYKALSELDQLRFSRKIQTERTMLQAM